MPANVPNLDSDLLQSRPNTLTREAARTRHSQSFNRDHCTHRLQGIAKLADFGCSKQFQGVRTPVRTVMLEPNHGS